MRIIPWEQIEKSLHSPSKSEIIRWRDQLREKYRERLGEVLHWDEDDEFCASEDVGVHSAVLLCHVAFTFETMGEREAASLLRELSDVSNEQLCRESEATDHAGYQTRFRQLLLGASLWLPFRRDIVIEEADWAGHPVKIGSVIALSEQLADLREFMKRADPDVTLWSHVSDEPPTVLCKAWQCSEPIAVLAAKAIERRLPMWTTG